MKAALFVVAGAFILAVTRPEIVTISGDSGEVSVFALAGVAVMCFGLRQSLAPSRAKPHWQ